MMTWAYPERWSWLWLLPLAAACCIWAFRARRNAFTRFADASVMPELTHSVHWRRRRLKALLVVCGLSSVLVALIGPQWGFQWQEVTRRGVDIVIALDVSNSMLAEDVKPNRLARAKLAIQEVLPQLRGDRIGLVAFAGTSFLQCPLTTDYGAVSLVLEEMSPDILPRGGTALAEAIRTGVTAFNTSHATSRALVLITDGEGHEGDPVAAARAANDAGVTIFCIGIGTPEGELIPVTDVEGQRTYLKDRQGRTVKSRLDERLLTHIALATNGSYVRATATSFGLDVLYRERMATMEQQASDTTLRKQSAHRFQWPLALALLLLGMEPMVSERKRGG